MIISSAALHLINNNIRDDLMNRTVRTGMFFYGIVASHLVMADCINTMPEKLMKDCIVYEDAGTSFPPSDYAHMNQYQDWMKTQQTKQAQRAHEEGSAGLESMLHVRLPTVH